jgi:hypothetical protein
VARNEAVAKAQRAKFVDAATKAVADGSQGRLEAEKVTTSASAEPEDQRQPRRVTRAAH